MPAILTLARKDLRLLFRDTMGFVFAFVFPLVYAVFFGAIFANVGGQPASALKIAIVDDDQTAESRAFVAALDKLREVEAVLAPRAAAETAVRRGERLAYIVLPAGFGAQRDGLFWGAPPHLTVGIDPSRQAEAGLLQGVVLKCAFAGLQDVLARPAALGGRVDVWLERLGESEHMDPVARGALETFFPALKRFSQTMQGATESAPAASAGGAAESEPSLLGGGMQPVIMDIEPVVRQNHGVHISSYAWSFPQGIIWGVIGCAAAFSMSLVAERSGGTLVRLRTAPLARWQILAGKATACFLATSAMIALLLLVAASAFRVYPQSIPLLLLAVLAVSLAFVGIMLLLSVLGKTEQSAAGIGWAVLLVMAMIGGGMVPRMFMPAWMQTVSHVSPVKWAIYALEGAIWRGLSPTEMLLPCGVLIAIGVVCFAIGVRTFRWSN
jgi:ABC-2 type transport system permease protein